MKVRPLPTLLAAVAMLAAGVVSAAVAATPRETAAQPTAVPAAVTPMQDGTRTVAAGKKVVGYFTEWGVYDRNYHVKNIKTSGSAAKLTNIVYAFGNTTGGRCTMGDAYAAYDKYYDAASSVDGVSDTWDTGALRGNFNQLRKLKREFPNIKVVWSFGGWTWSSGFTQAAQNPTAFADSCYSLIKDPRWADVFDGIDIDWEYPNACGLSCDTSGPNAFNNIITALRNKFGSSA
ncbi:MAG: chitinase, partial [Kribbellaceae bacterium]|nr:chitinase [Kribbellaceae bacterium]